MVSAHSGGMDRCSGRGQLGFAESARRLEPLGQGLAAAAEGHVQGVVGDVGHVGPEEGAGGKDLILPLCQGPSARAREREAV